MRVSLNLILNKVKENANRQMIRKWLHINEMGGDSWVLPIWSAIHQATKEGRMNALQEMGELTLHVSTKLNMLPSIIARINKGCQSLYQLIEKHEPDHECSKERDGYAFNIPDDLKYRLLIDIDSLFFELNSTCELMSSVLICIYKHTGKSINKKTAGSEIKNLIASTGSDPKWFSDLDSHRNFFMHEGAPYIAVDLTNSPNHADLIIMKENLKIFDDSKKYILLSELNEIVSGFSEGRQILQEHIIRYLNSVR